MLIEGPVWREKARALSRRPAEGEVADAVGEIAEKLRKYLWTRTVIGVLTALLYVGWLWAFGVDLLFVWGLLAFLLNYIPTLGSLLAGLAPIAYALLTRDLGTAAFAGAGILAIEQVMGNYVDPRMQGRQVSISPLVVLIVLLFWGWIWGVAGAVLAVPITIALLIVSSHVPPLRPLAVILHDESEER
jgi:AI-2 transport protein TqsA